MRLSSKGINEKQIHAKIDKHIAKLLPLIKDIFVGYEEDAPVEMQIQNLFKSNESTLAIAESCTGGEISSRLTKIPGSSEYFLGGITAYNNAAKKEILGVDEQLIKTHSVVSKEVSKEMAIRVIVDGIDLAIKCRVFGIFRYNTCDLNLITLRTIRDIIVHSGYNDGNVAVPIIFIKSQNSW